MYSQLSEREEFLGREIVIKWLAIFHLCLGDFVAKVFYTVKNIFTSILSNKKISDL